MRNVHPFFISLGIIIKKSQNLALFLFPETAL